MSEVKKEEIGYAWNFAADLGNGRQLSVSGNFAKGITAEGINQEVDKIRSVIDRQQAKSASRAAGEEIETLVLRLDSAKEDLAMLDEKGDAKGGLSAAERQQREAAAKHLDKMQKDIEFKKGVLEKLKTEAK